MRDLGSRLTALGGSEWMVEFTLQVRLWLESHLWEHANRTARRIPALEDYLANRPYSIGMYFEFLLSELTDGFRLTPTQRADPTLKRLAQMANNQIAWTNDILTLEKELAHGDVHNLVLSLMQSRGLALVSALPIAIAMHNDEVAAFIALQGTLPSTLQPYVQALGNWMGGHLQWGIASKRYGGSRAIHERFGPTSAEVP